MRWGPSYHSILNVYPQFTASRYPQSNPAHLGTLPIIAVRDEHHQRPESPTNPDSHRIARCCELLGAIFPMVLGNIQHTRQNSEWAGDQSIRQILSQYERLRDWSFIPLIIPLTPIRPHSGPKVAAAVQTRGPVADEPCQ